MYGIGQSLLLMQAGTSGRELLVFTVMAVVFIVPFLLGGVIARALRLEDLSTRIGVVLFSIFASLAPFIFVMMQTVPVETEVNGEKVTKRVSRSWKDAIPLGIDLAGGTNLLFQIDNQAAEQQQKKEVGKVIPLETIEKMVNAIKKRINPSGAEEVTVRRVGNDRIEIIIPGADPDLVEQKKRLITKLGSLEFGIVANERDHGPTIELAKKLPPNVAEVRGEENSIIASWRDVVDGKAEQDGRIGSREITRTDEKTGEQVKVVQFLIKHDQPDYTVTGKYLTNASPTADESGNPAVSFRFNPRGAALFGSLTQRNLPDPTDGFKRRLAILLDGKVHSAPSINSRITDSGQITGRFDMAEVNELVGVLNAGALEVPLKPNPISEFTISPLLGIDVQEKGINAIIASALVVFVFVLAYYRLAGLIAALSLVLNLLLVVGAMAFISATFTLPGLAGLVLTIGMAVDSNVLIYERMREELARGTSLRMAIQNGFEKAFAAIFDGNVTSLITALILYLIGTDLIRGFAVSLFIGLSMSLFSVLYFGHLAFDIIERKRWAKTLTMMQFIGQTKIDFLATRHVAFAGSAAVILLGLGALFVRGNANWDIDMSGGTMATFEFVEKQKTDDIRGQLEKAFPNGVSLERLTLAGEEQSAGKRFRVRTSEIDRAKVIEGINQAFDDSKYAVVRVAVDEIKTSTSGQIEGEASRFSLGQQAEVKLSGGMSAETFGSYLSETIESLPGGENGAKKYTSAQSLLHVAGTTEATKDPAIKLDPKYKSPAKFTAFTVQATPEITPEDFAASLKLVQDRLKSEPVLEEVNSFDTSVAAETQMSALWAILASLLMIIIYMWYRFEKVYFGLAAVAALAHDVLITIGAIALGAYLSKTPLGPILMLEDFKINMNQIACLLTIVGYSLNDTIVIFDRIREIKGKSPNITYDMINQSVNQTLSRTLLTAFTTFLVVLVLYIAGGEGIHGFAFSMIIGVITGCYSTVYIANPVLLWLVTREAKLKAQPNRTAKTSSAPKFGKSATA
ncbi:protein translocase subunit SecDF [Schlesneria paludicola]|uniref:protein translocase subunit SecDF n=1 Tax=Schlesneria paludicola TaxID=360056 RepID=UPI00029A5EB2|nr:protein translocase subunit SecDF [Schlesneria paludicola]